jgi:hypothetical protein
MSATQFRNVEFLMIGKAAGDAPATGEAISDLAAGEIGVFSVDGVRLGNTATNDYFILALGGANGKPAFVSEAIKSSSVKAISTKAGAVATEQRDTVGYDGTSGAIADLTASNLYMVDLYIQEYLTSNTDGRYIKHFQWESGSVAPTQMDVAYNMVKSAILNFSREAEDYMEFDLYSADAGAANTGAGTITLANGSKVATFGTNVDAVAVVGDYIRFDESAGGAPATTDAVYKVIAMDTVNQLMTLDRPYNGTSLSAAAETNAVIIAEATAAAAGFALTGKPLSFVIGKEFYKKVRWELSLSGFTTTAVRVAVADKGIGTYEEIASKEWFLKGNEGEYHRMGEPAIYSFASTAENRADSGAPTTDMEYDITTISFEDVSLVGFQNNVSPKQLTLATPEDLSANTYMNEAGEGVWATLASLTNLTVSAV